MWASLCVSSSVALHFTYEGRTLAEPRTHCVAKSGSLTRVSKAVIKLNYTNMGRKRVHLLHLTTCSPSIWEVSRQEPRGRNWSRGHRGVLLTGFLFLLSCSTQDRQPRGGTSHSDLGLSGYASHVCPQAKLVEASSHLRLPLPKWQTYVKLT